MSTRVRKERGAAISSTAFLSTSILAYELTGLVGMADGCQHSHWYFYILDTPMVLYWFSEDFFTLLSLLEVSSLLFGSSLGT